MSSSNLIRWGGLAAVMAGVLFVAADLLGLTLGDNFAEYAASGAFIVQQMLFLLGPVLLLEGSSVFMPGSRRSQASWVW